MSREDTVAQVRDLAGPLGPFQSLDEQSRRTDDWLRSIGKEILAQLLDLVSTPPSAAELRGAEADVFSDVLGELLSRVAALWPAESVPQLVARLDDDRARRFAAEALGASGSRDAQRELIAYLEAHPDLPPNEALPLVEAVAEVGGSDASSLLRAARRHLEPRPGARPLVERIDELLAGRL